VSHPNSRQELALMNEVIGSILNNILFVLGMCFFIGRTLTVFYHVKSGELLLGGILVKDLRFNTAFAHVKISLLLIGGVAKLVSAVLNSSLASTTMVTLDLQSASLLKTSRSVGDIFITSD
jgi:Ca2+/H+ antiporter